MASASHDSQTQHAHQPYVPDEANEHELTWPAVLVGAILGIIFGAASLYLVLRVGMTISASIPIAVMSITLFRAFSKVFGTRKATILENNIVQTTGSAGESIAFGVGVTMPALMILGFEMDVLRVMVVACLGGLLGILMMIPLRRAFIVKQHGKLPYPEGTACADVLIVGEKGGGSAKTVFAGFGIAFVYQTLMQAFQLWKGEPEKHLAGMPKAAVGMSVEPAMLGVGYIIGPKIASIMMAGGVMSALILTPAIAMFGGSSTQPVAPAKGLISQFSEGEIRKEYVLFIGAGAVAAGGIISLCQALPLIFSSIVGGLRDVRAGAGSTQTVRRTERDMSPKVVLIGSALLLLLVWLTPQLNVNPLGAFLILLFGFLFVTVSSRLTGEIGSSSNPISGMTVATLLLTCLIFLVCGWVTKDYRLTALSIAAIVCIAASNGGTTSQDLKTGFLVGATPRYQQLSLLVGALTSALVIGVVLLLLNQASTVYTKQNLPNVRCSAEQLDKLPSAELSGSGIKLEDGQKLRTWNVGEGEVDDLPEGKYLVDDQGTIIYFVDPGINGTRKKRDDGGDVIKYDAPKARLMAMIIGGILSGEKRTPEQELAFAKQSWFARTAENLSKSKLPWALVLLGTMIALVMELCGVPALPFAVGLYLPMSASVPIFIGGMARWGVDKLKPAKSAAEADMSPGVLFSSGYIAGGAIAGILVAILALAPWADQLATFKHSTYQTTSPSRSESDTTLGQSAGNALGDANAAGSLFALNQDEVKTAWRLPAGTMLMLPTPERSAAPQEGETLAAFAKRHDARAVQIYIRNSDLLAPKKVEEPFTASMVLHAKTSLRIPEELYKVSKETTLGELAKELEARKVGVSDLFEKNKGTLAGLLQVPDQAKLSLPKEISDAGQKGAYAVTPGLDENGKPRKRTLKEIAVMLEENQDKINEMKGVARDSKIQAQEALEMNAPDDPKVDDTWAGEIFDLNVDTFAPDFPVEPNKVLKLPQSNGLAVFAFCVLLTLLILVGLEKILKSEK